MTVPLGVPTPDPADLVYDPHVEAAEAARRESDDRLARVMREVVGVACLMLGLAAIGTVAYVLAPLACLAYVGLLLVITGLYLGST